ncbi:MAG TPA: hypothetical protein VFL47_04170 [Flavisolibacter sp.]|nr:hypothetical protein [Flavisolibacter sp.]
MRKLKLLLLILLSSFSVFAQTDSLLFSSLSEGHSPVDAGEPIFVGREHLNYLPSIIGVPYYATPDWQEGTLLYQGILYKDLFLKYDLVADELVVRHLNGIQGIVLFTPRIERFTLGDKMFVHLTAPAGETIKPGVYELLTSGKLSLYAKRSMWIEEKVQTTIIERSFQFRNTYSVLKEGQYYQVKNDKTLRNLLSLKKTEIKSLLKAAQIKFKTNPDAALQIIVAHYNQTNR